MHTPPTRSGSGEPTTRGLKLRVPKHQLYRLVPTRPKRKLLSRVERIDQLRSMLRAWSIWVALAILFLQDGDWFMAATTAFVSFVSFHTAPSRHAAIYAVEPNLDTASQEFQDTMAGLTGMIWINGNLVAILNSGIEFYPAMSKAIDAAQFSSR